MTPVTTPPQPAPAADAPLHAEQVRLLFRFSLVGYLASLLVVFILGAILWEDLARPALFAWFVAISLVGVGRYLLYKAFIQSAPPDSAMVLWETRFIAGTVLAGLCWMSIGTVLLPDSARMVQRLSVVMLVMLLITGAVGYYAPHRYAYKLTAFLGLVPLAVTLGASDARPANRAAHGGPARARRAACRRERGSAPRGTSGCGRRSRPGSRRGARGPGTRSACTRSGAGRSSPRRR